MCVRRAHSSWYRYRIGQARRERERRHLYGHYNLSHGPNYSTWDSFRLSRFLRAIFRMCVCANRNNKIKIKIFCFSLSGRCSDDATMLLGWSSPLLNWWVWSRLSVYSLRTDTNINKWRFSCGDKTLLRFQCRFWASQTNSSKLTK